MGYAKYAEDNEEIRTERQRKKWTDEFVQEKESIGILLHNSGRQYSAKTERYRELMCIQAMLNVKYNKLLPIQVNMNSPIVKTLSRHMQYEIAEAKRLVKEILDKLEKSQAELEFHPHILTAEIVNRLVEQLVYKTIMAINNAVSVDESELDVINDDLMNLIALHNGNKPENEAAASTGDVSRFLTEWFEVDMEMCEHCGKLYPGVLNKCLFCGRKGDRT